MFDLVLLIAVTEFKRTYFGTALGYLWSIMRPLALFAVLLEVFTHVFRLGSEVNHYPVLLLFNLVLYGFYPEWTWLLLPFVLGGMFVFTTAVSMIVASLYPRFRDIAIIWAVFSTALFYATPVLYPLERAPDSLRTVLLINPITSMLELAREWVIDPSAPPLSSITGSTIELFIPVVVFIAVCAYAVWIFNREAPRIAEEL